LARFAGNELMIHSESAFCSLKGLKNSPNIRNECYCSWVPIG